MVSVYGMSNKVGNISFYNANNGDYSFQKPYSEKTAEVIDEEAKELVDKVYTRAKEIIAEHKDQLAQLAQQLLEREVIFTEDVERIFGKRKFANKRQEEALYGIQKERQEIEEETSSKQDPDEDDTPPPSAQTL